MELMHKVRVLESGEVPSEIFTSWESSLGPYQGNCGTYAPTIIFFFLAWEVAWREILDSSYEERRINDQ